MSRITHTFATLEISPAAFKEIWSKLQAAGYQDAAIPQDDGRLVIDMHGIGLLEQRPLISPETRPCECDICREFYVSNISKKHDET